MKGWLLMRLLHAGIFACVYFPATLALKWLAPPDIAAVAPGLIACVATIAYGNTILDWLADQPDTADTAPDQETTP